MMHLFKYFYVLCLLSAYMLKAQEIPVTGTWEVYDYEYDIELDCECTAKQKKALEKGIRENIVDELNDFYYGTYFEFDGANKVEGFLIEEEFETTYKQEGNSITIYFEDDNNIQLKLIPQEYERLMIFEFDDELLENSKRSFKSEYFGQINFGYTQVRFFFDSLTDDAYDDYVDAKDFEED